MKLHNSYVLLKKFVSEELTCSIAWIVITMRLSDFKVYDMISSMESNWVTDSRTLTVSW